jgi:phage FluMu protein Com
MRPIPSLLALAALLLPVVATAEDTKSADNPQIYLWHFQRGCAPDARLQEAVRVAVKRLAYPVTTLRVPADWAGCQGESCAKLLRQRCPSGMHSGAIVGGRGEQRGRWTVYSVWLYDLATGKTAYLDHYCPDCDLQVKLADSVPLLIERPTFGPSTKPIPAFCAPLPSEASEKPSLPPVTKVHYIAYGEGRHKAAIQSAMESVIKSTGMRADEITIRAKDYNNPDVVARIVSKGQPEQVLVADVQQDGKVELFLYDARNQTSDYLAIDCPACDKEELISKLRTATGNLLDRCRGDQCGSRAQTMPAPPEVCQPFPVCNGANIAVTSADLGNPMSSVQAHRNRIVTGLAWGAFAASAATSILLFGLDQTSISTIQSNGRAVDHTLYGPAWAMAGASLLTLGVAIPTTLLLDRGSGGAHGSNSGSSTSFQCPQ